MTQAQSRLVLGRRIPRSEASRHQRTDIVNCDNGCIPQTVAQVMGMVAQPWSSVNALQHMTKIGCDHWPPSRRCLDFLALSRSPRTMYTV